MNDEDFIPCFAGNCMFNIDFKCTKKIENISPSLYENCSEFWKVPDQK